MLVEIDLRKSVDENAGIYFNKAKKLKKKLEGAKATVKKYEQKLSELEGKQVEFEKKEKKRVELKAKKEESKRWYHKFHWFLSSEGLICVGGRDASQNEILIKKQMEKDDYVLHTDMAGSPFFLVKNGQSSGSLVSIEECAQAVACYSKAWKQGLGTVEVLYVKPDQVSKEALPGESLKKGSFMIRGETKYFHPKVEFAFTVLKGEIIGGPALTIKKKAEKEKIVTVLPGREKKSVISKKIIKTLKGDFDINELVSLLPAGGAEIKRVKKRK